MRKFKDIKLEYFKKNEEILFPNRSHYKKYRLIDPINMTYTDHKVKPKDKELIDGKVIHEIVDEDGFKKHQSLYYAQENAIYEIWKNDMQAEFPNLNSRVFDLCLSTAYERGHSSGHDEVYNYMIEIARFAEEIIEASK